MTLVALSVDDVLAIHVAAMKRTGEPSHVLPKTRDGIESLLYTAQYQEDPLSYAAAVLYYIARAQHFANGSKRTAWACCIRALNINGLDVSLSDEQAEALVLKVAKNEISRDALSDDLGAALIEL